MGRAKTKVICRDCGEECRIVPLGFKCACGFGLVCQWDACVARGVFLGRIQFPETSEVLT